MPLRPGEKLGPYEVVASLGAGGMGEVYRARKPAFKAGQPRMLFEGPYFKSGHDIAVTPDGKGFVLIRESEGQTGPGEIGVVVNWPEELRQRVK